MTEAIDFIDRFCVYGVVYDYQGLIEAVRVRIEELETTHESLDHVSGLQSGYISKIVAPIPIKSMGKISMGPVLQTTGLAIIVVRDDEQFAKIKDRLTRRVRPRKLANVSSARPTWLFRKKKAREMGKRRWSVLTELQRKKLARKMGIASGLARRRKARKSINVEVENAQ